MVVARGGSPSRQIQQRGRVVLGIASAAETGRVPGATQGSNPHAEDDCETLAWGLVIAKSQPPKTHKASAARLDARLER